VNSKKVVIIDYGMGNVASVQKALNYLQINNEISNSEKEIESADFLILPGVGSYRQGMSNLKEYGLLDILNDQVLIKLKPILGICLGMQLFSESGTEPEYSKGLGWIKGEVVKIPNSGLRIPHLGWNNTCFLSPKWSEFNDKDFYYIHSYHFAVNNKENVLATVNYGIELVAAIQYKNIMATQFHPEKSQEIGLSLLKQFFINYAKN
jgi:glutamine amidotransferase